MAITTTDEDINIFLNGRDPMEHIVSIECGYKDERVSIIYNNPQGEKRIKLDDFKPFVWAKNSVAVRMFEGDRKTLKKKMFDYGIGVKALITSLNGEKPHERIENGYKLMFYAKKRMTYQKFLEFFQLAKTPIFQDKSKKTTEPIIDSKEFLAVSPIEQYMISSGKRMFKGYDDYDRLTRLQFDLETQGLDPTRHRIDQIGIRTNKGFEKILTIVGDTNEERDKNELMAIIEFIEILAKLKPDVIAGHNSENFDWNFIIVRCQVLGTTLEEISQAYFKYPIYKRKKESTLKLGGEVEYFKQTIMWGHNIVDSLHAVRRAQAIDSSMKSANLKYVTKYLNLKKQNRVYVPGDKIGEIWRVTSPSYAFNDENGDWYQISENKPLESNYKAVSGRYIVERYLLDDIWETDKVELALNQSNFLVCKLMPTTFQRACTMGTAGIWKLISLAWAFENNLCIPAFAPQKKFTGGLSRLLNVGFADDVVKLDYNSLYPSIMLTWNIESELDISHSLRRILNHVLTQREYYKEQKAICKAKAKDCKIKLNNWQGDKSELNKIKLEQQHWEAEASSNDKKQLPLKILANSLFGSFGNPTVYNLGSITKAEEITCRARMCLRLMICHFTKLGYKPIVGDSFTADTPLFIKYKDNNLIDIKPISEIINETQINIDELGREYDYSKKTYQVLCRSGWHEVEYVYRHKTDKKIYSISDESKNMMVDVTEDHSLFNDKQEKISPKQLTDKTQLEYYNNLIATSAKTLVSNGEVKLMAKMLINGSIDRVPIQILNGTDKMKQIFLSEIDKSKKELNVSKTCLAGLYYIRTK